jgi:hypothetical protein
VGSYSSKREACFEYSSFIHLLYIHNVHISFNKTNGCRICHQIIHKYKIYIPY